ncbi:hypothetical protein Mapa_005468 [Marchantia paleacea]|nr:hypothetical protein Mapa_005468 [Marchantia paleacea]
MDSTRSSTAFPLAPPSATAASAFFFSSRTLALISFPCSDIRNLTAFSNSSCPTRFLTMDCISSLKTKLNLLLPPTSTAIFSSSTRCLHTVPWSFGS